MCVTKPLQGYDFLNHFSLTVDCTNNRQIVKTTNRQSNAKLSPLIMNITLCKYNAADITVWKIMERYSKLISPHCNHNSAKSFP